MNLVDRKVSANTALASLILGALLIGFSATALDVSNTPESGYILCVNKKTKAVTYPASLNCAAAETKLLIGGQKQVSGSGSQTGGSTSVEAMVNAVLPKVEGATYAVECEGNIVTATGININLSADAKKKGYKGAVVAASWNLENCLGKSVPVTQDGKNFGGYVWNIDEENRLALIMTIATVKTLNPAPTPPARGAFLMTYVRGGQFVPEGSIGTGTLANINPDFDEEIANIWIGGNSRDSSAPIVDKNGDFISVGFRKPGVLCRNLITCAAGSDFNKWS